MFTSLVESTRPTSGELCQKSIEELADRLYKNLKGRRYLIVMDDIWDTKAWDDVKRFFPDDNNGSRIILTTRQSEIAIYANSNSPIHHMSLLSSNASWNLLRKTVFGQEDCPSGSKKIGWKIAHNCKGLPLAIVVIGGLLSKDNKQKDWEQIAEGINSAVSRNVGDQFMEILSLSYNCLPHHLKACFLYMGIFPEDYEIYVSQLIKLWIAEGFIKPVTPKSFEEVADNYLKDLINRSLIQNLQTLSEVTDFKCTEEVFKIMPNLKKLGISYFHNKHTKWSSYEFDSFAYLHHLETLKCLFIKKDYRADKPLPINLAFPQNLKKLTLSGCRISWKKITVVGSLPNLEILKLKHHAFEGSIWEAKEGEFTKLKYLLIYMTSLEHWRANSTHFPQLRHLSLSFCFNLAVIPSEIGDIQTLELVELFECSPSAVASAMVIQEEKQSLGNDRLRVRVKTLGDYYNSDNKTSLKKVHRTLSESTRITFRELESSSDNKKVCQLI
ncbi:putative late blight resistance proteinR1A-10 [Sesamum alatum]|uniref:Late blight resistance proteinR1A-10 n=1 Tax=Sesamum alatum TaxID=300844 RepID=A0AAE2CLZ0_9LAMI|nr:putative late blight resistance proteinR1A-10 [Sesamum alatum]